RHSQPEFRQNPSRSPSSRVKLTPGPLSMNNDQPNAAPAPNSSTLAGNYFISNYPPFSFWSDDQKVEVEVALNSESVPGTKLGVYHHIPFCRKRCHFCYRSEE